MSQLVNHSELQNISSVTPNLQIFLRLDNGLSGKDGFGRTNVDTFEKGLTVFSTVENASASWSNAALSSIAFQSAYNDVNTYSANWNEAFTRSTVFQSNSARWAATSNVVEPNSAKWNATFTTVSVSSAKWNSTNISLSSLSATWNSATTTLSTNSANWQSTTNQVAASANLWNSNWNNTQEYSANWDSTYNTVSANSSIWNKANDTVLVGKTLSASNILVNFTTVSDPVFVLGAPHAAKTIICNAVNGAIVGIPKNSDVSFPVETQITFISFHSTGTTIFSADPAVTINSFNNSLSAGGKNAAVTFLKSDTNTWFLIGNLA